MKKRYNIYIRKYNILARDYVSYIRIVFTDDIYHEIGKIVCNSIEKIDSISYTAPYSSIDECESFWSQHYEKISDFLWREKKLISEGNL